MKLPTRIKKYCANNSIQWNHEGFDQYEFIAPTGYLFANGSKYRIQCLEDGVEQVKRSLELRYDTTN